MRIQKTVLSLAFLPFFLSACSTTHQNYIPKTPNPQVNPLSNQSALAIISQESQKAQIAQQLLVKYRQQQNQILQIKNADFDNDKIHINYIGKPTALLDSIAIKYGYRFIEVGNKRELPTINFTDFYTTPYDSLALIDGQLGDTAQIYLNKEQKLISLVYN